MRIIAGKHRGRKLDTIEGKQLRPTTGMAREAIFNILAHGNFGADESNILDGCRVLDLFCGCGALAAEAISRGAERAVLIDMDSAHLELARGNIDRLGEGGKAAFIRADSSNPPMAQVKCNLVFVDPPYNQGLVEKSLKNIIAAGWVESGAIIIVESGKMEEFTFPEQFTILDSRIYSASKVTFLRFVGSS